MSSASLACMLLDGAAARSQPLSERDQCHISSKAAVGLDFSHETACAKPEGER